MITLSEDNRFALSNRFFSYVLCVTPEGLLKHVYYGAPLNKPLKIYSHYERVARGATSNFEGVTDLNLNEMPQEYPAFGQSDYRAPAFHGLNGDGNSVFSLLYKRHRIEVEKPRLTDLPSARGGGSETLIVTLEDTRHKLTIDLLYTIYADYGVLVRSAKFKNEGDQDIQLQHVASTALDLSPSDYEILHLNGTWAREFNEERLDVPNGRFVIDSTRGTSSAAHTPFIGLLQKGTTEDYGHVYATSLVYSGNFSISVETGEFGDIRVLAGINPFDFNWQLNPSESFETPEALHVYANNGLRGMSHIWHNFVRDKITPERFRNAARPTYLNTWEATYFDVNEDKVTDMANKAKQIGVDMLVLDDGWFEGRNDDTSSLGDWTADKKSFPSGIPALAAKLKTMGLKFGIWFEPEMVNPKSALYEKHPDWALHVPGREPSLGRNQLTLDLSRAEVTDYIFEQMDNILSCGEIDYVKWDMNRNMTEVGSAGWPKSQQREVFHRYILGLYSLLGKLTEKYPNIIFENCASGGNRFDLGMLSFMPQGWISDMCDPIGRLEIINGSSYLYPLDTMAAYIGPSPNHQNGRSSSLKTRFHAGFFCAARGVSLNEAAIDADRDEIKSYMAFAKTTADDMVGGRFDRLMKTDNDICWQYTNRNDNTVYVCYFHILAAPNLPLGHVRLTGLDPDAIYTLEDGRTYQGDALMKNGLSLPITEKGDFASYLFVFKKTAS